MAIQVKEIEEEITPLDLSKSSHNSDNDIRERICLSIQNTCEFYSEKENAMNIQKIDDIDSEYSSIMRRVFWQFFKSHDAYQKLLLYCKKFNEHLEPEPTTIKLATTFYEVNWIKRVNDTVNVKGEGFSLNESEKVLFKKFYSIECVADMSSELDKDLIGSLESEPGFKFHRAFRSCGTKCYSYLNYANRFPWP
ncbi:hypothetical protein NPIL_80701 [Nephila pilipes]|uniref:Uncharacterized protein n=1 Tax=Nephila pilipes TaxID=299642 RepID=A0A8X6MT67_NEPPI|nr:hypothetical protein NPIL_80701 [Nephila pilipes]